MAKDIYIYPSKKSRRVLITISDLLISFIVSVFLYEIVILSIAKPIIKYNDIQMSIYDNEVSSRDLLIDNNLLIQSEEEYNFSKDLEVSAISYIQFYTFDEEKYKNNDYLYHYFVELNENSIDYLNDILLEKCPTFFDIDNKTILGTYAFKSSVKESFIPYFTLGDEMSETQQSLFNEFKEKRFLSLYQTIISDLKTNEKIKNKEGKTYVFYMNNIKNEEEKIKKCNMICTFISFFITSIILYFIIPLTNHKGRTISEIILKVERINTRKISYLNKRYVLLEGLINTFESMSIIMFIPFIELGLSGIFSFPILYTVSLVSMVFLLLQLILLLANKYAKTLKELSTNSMCIDTSTMDDYFRETSNI